MKITEVNLDRTYKRDGPPDAPYGYTYLFEYLEESIEVLITRKTNGTIRWSMEGIKKRKADNMKAAELAIVKEVLTRFNCLEGNTVLVSPDKAEKHMTAYVFLKDGEHLDTGRIHVQGWKSDQLLWNMVGDKPKPSESREDAKARLYESAYKV